MQVNDEAGYLYVHPIERYHKPVLPIYSVSNAAEDGMHAHSTGIYKGRTNSAEEHSCALMWLTHFE